jgi:hypothetical protein
MSVALDPVALAKRALGRLLSEQTIGMIDYMRSRDRGAAWDHSMDKTLAGRYLWILLRTHGRTRS